MDVDLEALLVQGVGRERRARRMVESRTGRSRRAIGLPAGEQPRDLALDATLKRAALRRARAGAPAAGEPLIARADLCRRQRYRPGENLIVLLVDSSDSMGEGVEARMKACKGAVLAVLRKAYQQRSRVAVIAFGGEVAKVVLPPTRSISRARDKLEKLPVGGATPFADGLSKAWQMVRRERLKNPGVRSVLVIVSDGEANVPLVGGAPAVPELFALAGRVSRDWLVTALIDVVTERGKGLEMRRLARHLGASYVRVSDLKARDIIQAVEVHPGRRQMT